MFANGYKCQVRCRTPRYPLGQARSLPPFHPPGPSGPEVAARGWAAR